MVQISMCTNAFSSSYSPHLFSGCCCRLHYHSIHFSAHIQNCFKNVTVPELSIKIISLFVGFKNSQTLMKLHLCIVKIHGSSLGIVVNNKSPQGKQPDVSN
jgi:hypothetical protein